MAEHDSDREDREPDEQGVPLDGEQGVPLDGEQGVPLDGEQGVPFDEDAAWAAIVAGYGEEPPDPPGAKPFKPVEGLASLETNTSDGHTDDTDGTGTGTDDGKDSGESDGTQGPAKPLGSSIAFAPGVGPRDYSPPEPSEDDFGEDDEGHFVPPEPPPLPATDTTARFAWLGVVGGPILLLVAVLLGWDMTWWLTTLGIGGFLGGFITLVTRMRTDDDENDDPDRGAVV